MELEHVKKICSSNKIQNNLNWSWKFISPVPQGKNKLLFIVKITNIVCRIIYNKCLIHSKNVNYLFTSLMKGLILLISKN